MNRETSTEKESPLLFLVNLFQPQASGDPSSLERADFEQNEISQNDGPLELIERGQKR